jgi:hypothetical protein
MPQAYTFKVYILLHNFGQAKQVTIKFVNSTKHFSREHNDWFARNQDNVSRVERYIYQWIVISVS